MTSKTHILRLSGGGFLMKYELVTALRTGTDNWLNQKKRLEENQGTLITLSPDPFLMEQRRDEFPRIINAIDFATKRKYDRDQYLFFNKVPTVDGAEIFLEKDGQYSIIKDGTIIAKMRVFPNTRRHVKDVTYVNADGSQDYIEEYTFDGQLFSRLFYYEDKVQQICFFNSDERVVVRFHFYEGSINLVTTEDPETGNVTQKYDSLADFYNAQVKQIVTEKDEVEISYFGMELDGLQGTTSANTLYLDESPFDDSGRVKGNLGLVLNDDITDIQHVNVDTKWKNELIKSGVSLDKVVWISNSK